MTEKELLENGATVRVAHLRNSDSGLGTMWDFREAGITPYPNGGATAAVVTFPNGVQGTGLAVCSTKDAFNKKIGRAKAVGRAVADAIKLQASGEALNG